MTILLGGARNAPKNAYEDLVRRVVAMETLQQETGPRIATLEARARTTVQKVGFLRFNPFQDTGGDNSFVLALLDQEHNGVVVSSLYSRDGTRIYAKKIELGTTTHPLLEEEQQVLHHVMTPQEEKR